MACPVVRHLKVVAVALAKGSGSRRRDDGPGSGQRRRREPGARCQEFHGPRFVHVVDDHGPPDHVALKSASVAAEQVHRLMYVQAEYRVRMRRASAAEEARDLGQANRVANQVRQCDTVAQLSQVGGPRRHAIMLFVERPHVNARWRDGRRLDRPAQAVRLKVPVPLVGVWFRSPREQAVPPLPEARAAATPQTRSGRQRAAAPFDRDAQRSSDEVGGTAGIELALDCSQGKARGWFSCMPCTRRPPDIALEDASAQVPLRRRRSS